ncbi:SusC/RagA family TonB-linked outer membrane protein [Danxiaibacter flavus]|uniref:SusC/RagA family TonB-linked outer membrane protein n=1 Tax=Danxiaibacter flavus TaxID=3049108 RepID=A0ABV3ZKJ5_9BACT|nr:SusC/RagA family TonB-linked outer membrane protein [Chitinophagaceae bacterium DXS]
MKCLLTDVRQPLASRLLLIIKIMTICMLAFSLQASAEGRGKKLSVKTEKTEITAVLKAIEKQSNFRFVYKDIKNLTQKVSVNLQDADIQDVLDQVLQNTGLTYEIMDDGQIIIKEAAAGYHSVQANVTGTVRGDSGVLAGVSVQVKGTTRGTATNEDGKFSISAEPTDVLVFSYVGHISREITVGTQTEINVTLASEAVNLDGVVVVGYGTARKKDLTGAVANIKGDELSKQPVLTATQALQGKAAGVQIISSGAPNSSPSVRIRGTGSMLAGVNPLYVVDGVITDDITNINTADILSMDVLKDASSTAIYGVRAANGVLIITTKKGRSGKMVVNYDGTIGVKEAAHLVNMAGSHQYVGYLNEASRYYGNSDNLVDTALLNNGSNTDWYDQILRRGLQQNNNLSISGGSEKINYYLSAGYLLDEGIIKNNSFRRFTIRNNNEYKFNNKLKLTTVISYANGVLDDVDLNSAYGNSYRAAPVVPARVGTKYGNTSAFQNVGNPLLDIDKNYNRGNDNRIQGAATFEYKILPWLVFSSNIGVDLDFYKNTQYAYQYFADSTIFDPPGGNQQQPVSVLQITKNDANRWLWDNTLTASKKFGDHNLKLMIGTTAEQYKFNRLYGYRQNVPPAKNQWFLDAGDANTAKNNGSGDKWARNSYIARFNYDYKDRYLVTATFRGDGSSRFPEGNRWGFFPSVGLGWNITSEDFMKDQKTFSYLKLRASWGRVGNDQIPSSLYLPLASPNLPYGNLGSGIAFNQITDPNLKWETTEEFDFGLDFTVLDKRLNGTIDLYSKKTNDALIYVNILGTLGDQDSKYLTNAAAIQNKGVELGLTWSDKIGKDWTYSISGNGAYNKNEVVGLSSGQPLVDGNLAGQGYVTLSPNGQPIGSYNVLKVAGIFQNQEEIDNYKNKAGTVIQPDARPGDFKYVDQNGDGVIDANDRVLVGSYQPKFIYGFSGSVTYKSFDLSFGTYGTSGGKIYNAKKALRASTNSLDNMEASVVTDRWTVDNKSNSNPRATLNQWPASTYFVEQGGFFRINNLTIGYTLPQDMLKKAKITKLRVYATVQNLATITNYTGFTPEFSAISTGVNALKADPNSAANQTNLGITNAGVDINTYPTPRTWVFGINLGF